MTEPTSGPPVALPASRRFLPWLLLLFFGSGCAALIYEIVWFQLLQLVIGSSAVSLGVLLGTFMGGMCLGSLLLPRLIGVSRHPLRVYASIEAGIGILGLGVLALVPLVAHVYVAFVGRGLPGILLRGTVCGVCLLPPTMLMGATLPAISRWVETTPRGVSWLGFFYGGNIAGAVFGCLLAGFYLLRIHDMATATFVAAAINAIVAAAGFVLAARAPSPNEANQSAAAIPSVGPSPHPDPLSHPMGVEREQQSGRAGLSETSLGQLGSAAQNAMFPANSVRDSAWVCLTIAISGMTALGAEVIWTRLLSLLLGSTVYTFSIILAVFLVGLGLGSGAGSLLAREIKRPGLALAWCQFLLAGGIGWTAWMLGRSIPFWPVNPSLAVSPWFNFQLDLARCFWAILPPTCLWGASFPIALAAAAKSGEDPGRLVSRVYAANTVGAILGALLTSILLIRWLGTQHAQQVLICLSIVAALIMTTTSIIARAREGFLARSPALVWTLAATAAAILVAWGLPAIPWKLVAHGRYIATYGEDRTLLYVGEGMNASVAVTQMPDGVRNFHVSGKIEASSDPRDMRLQRMLGHIPGLIHPDPHSVLVVGCGAGVTAGSFLTYPGITNIVICEIEPLIPKVVAQFFAEQNYNVVKSPRVRIVFDDARHFVLTTREKFDIITSDPIHPWVKGAATLYTREYFELCKQHLNPGGLDTQWVPLYESNSGVVKSEVATFFEVFTNGTVWSNDDSGQGYDTVLLGSAEPVHIDVDEIQQRLETDNYRAVAESLGAVGFQSALQLLATYAGRASDLAPWLRHAEINRDGNLRLQYLAGMAPNQYQEGAIYNEMVVYRQFPEELFSGSDGTRDALRIAIEQREPGK